MPGTIPIVATATFLGTGAIAMASSVEPTNAVIMAGVVAGAITQILAYLSSKNKADREERERQFDRDERIRVAEGVKQNQALVAGHLKAAIEENTQISVQAFHAANDVNEKIAAIGGLRVKQAADRQTDRIEEVVKDTNAIVHDLTGKP